MVTEVNMNVATYIKFEDISNALVELDPQLVRPTRVDNGQQSGASSTATLEANSFGQPQMGTGSVQGGRPRPQLDTSFDVHMTLGNALDQLMQTGPSSSSGQQQAQQQQFLFATPSLGEYLSSLEGKRLREELREVLRKGKKLAGNISGERAASSGGSFAHFSSAKDFPLENACRDSCVLPACTVLHAKLSQLH